MQNSQYAHVKARAAMFRTRALRPYRKKGMWIETKLLERLPDAHFGSTWLSSFMTTVSSWRARICPLEECF